MLTIETGAIIPNADSYATLEQFIQYAGDYSASIPDDGAQCEALLRRAYLQMAAMRWQGSAVSADQTGAWPRSGATINGFAVASDSIPSNIRLGQMALAAEIYRDDAEPPEAVQGPVLREKVGDLSVTYASAQKRVAASARRSVAFFGAYLNLSFVQARVYRG